MILLSIFLNVKGLKNENRKFPLLKKLENMDPIGCLTFVGAVCCLLLALQWGGQSKPWNSSTVIGLLVGFVVLACIFTYHQWRRQEKALIPLRVLLKRSIFTGAMVLFFLGASTYLVNASLNQFILMIQTFEFNSTCRMCFFSPFIFRLFKESIRSKAAKILSHCCYQRWSLWLLLE